MNADWVLQKNIVVIESTLTELQIHTMPQLNSIKKKDQERSLKIVSGPTIVGHSTKKLEGARNGGGRAVPRTIPSISSSGRGYCGTQTKPKLNK